MKLKEETKYGKIREKKKLKRQMSMLIRSENTPKK